MKKLINTIHDIFLGAWYSLTDNKETRQMSKGRMSICRPCNKNVIGICKMCGCKLKFKTRIQRQECPINKW
jgi:hypothetical protein